MKILLVVLVGVSVGLSFLVAPALSEETWNGYSIMGPSLQSDSQSAPMPYSIMNDKKYGDAWDRFGVSYAYWLSESADPSSSASSESASTSSPFAHAPRCLGVAGGAMSC